MIAEVDTIFRVTTPEQMLALREAAARGGEEVDFPGGLDVDYWAHRWWMLLASGDAVVFASDSEGCVGGSLLDDIHNGDRICVEGFWFVPPESRNGVGLQLLSALEDAAREAGAVRLILGHHDTDAAPRLARVYKRLGYETVSCHYTKDL